MSSNLCGYAVIPVAPEDLGCSLVFHCHERQAHWVYPHIRPSAFYTHTFCAEVIQDFVVHL